MAYELRAGQGSAFVNNDRKEEWMWPYKGDILLPDGKRHFLDVKPTKTSAGEWMFHIKIGKEKQPKQQTDNNFEQNNAPVATVTKPVVKPVVNPLMDNDDDIPF
tara:strand:+ start:346 stop:657 length:312 start_codon:yes stop_codon:yes gene_type:complete